MGKPRDATAKAIWHREVKMIFCELCLKEIEIGNRPTTFINKEGWQNIINCFAERTGREYNKLQLKNKWDQLKKDWKLWKKLKQGSTGLRWHLKKKSIDVSDDWWKEKLKVLPNAKKFRYAGIDPELEEKLDIMFEGVIAIDSYALAPNQEAPQDVNEQVKSVQIESSNDLVAESGQNVITNTESSHCKRPASDELKGHRNKRSGAMIFGIEISELVTIVTNMIAARSKPDVSPSESFTIGQAIRALDQMTEVTANIPLYLSSLKLLRNLESREIFIAMAPNLRIHFLRQHYENPDM